MLQQVLLQHCNSIIAVRVNHKFLKTQAFSHINAFICEKCPTIQLKQEFIIIQKTRTDEHF